MAKQLLLNVLMDHLGQFVEGLSESNMKFGVWSGKIELANLQLKPGVLNHLNLPIVITHGSLKKLKLRIPWASLDSKPVRVFIDGLYIVISPLDINTQTHEQIKKNASIDKRNKLKNAQTKILKSTTESNTNSNPNNTTNASYIQHLIAKIIDNLEITITNIHIRYEDKLTIPGVIFSAGLTLDTMALSSTE